MNDSPSPEDLRHVRLAAASNPRRARQSDAAELSRLFAAAFEKDPVMNWIARPGPERRKGLERFFRWVLSVRTIPFGEVWMADDASACAAWLPPTVPASPGGLLEQIKLFPMFVQLCGFRRLLRGQAMANAMEKNHPHQRHFYLAFIAVAPELQGMGLGSAMVKATLKRVDASGSPAYLENSNPKNTLLYERYRFGSQKNIAPKAAPPLVAMWRRAR